MQVRDCFVLLLCFSHCDSLTVQSKSFSLMQFNVSQFCGQCCLFHYNIFDSFSGCFFKKKSSLLSTSYSVKLDVNLNGKIVVKFPFSQRTFTFLQCQVTFSHLNNHFMHLSQRKCYLFISCESLTVMTSSHWSHLSHFNRASQTHSPTSFGLQSV